MLCVIQVSKYHLIHRCMSMQSKSLGQVTTHRNKKTKEHKTRRKTEKKEFLKREERKTKSHLETKFKVKKLYGSQMVINAIMTFSLTQCVHWLSTLGIYGDWIHL